MPELLRFDDQKQQRSSDFVIFTVASNFSLFFSVSSSIDRCSFASEVHDHNSFISQLTQPGILKVSEAGRLSSFFDSYGLGIRMISGLEGLLLSSLDAKLAPKHLFRLCLEHEQKLNSSYKSAHAYNFYKDSNAPVMVKMVELVTILQQRNVFLLNECDDHPALQKIVDVIEMILAIPLSTPLAKAQTATKCFLSLEGDHLTLINVYWAFDEFLEKSKIGINKEKAEKSLKMVQGKFHQ
ncbi:hypothetical protein ACSBR2_016105 [Camellia fascicularis]